jgi:hypothetical protein
MSYEISPNALKYLGRKGRNESPWDREYICVNLTVMKYDIKRLSEEENE